MAHSVPFAGLSGTSQGMRVSWVLGDDGTCGRAVEIRQPAEITVSVDGELGGAASLEASYDGMRFVGITEPIPCGRSITLRRLRQRHFRPRRVAGEITVRLMEQTDG